MHWMIQENLHIDEGLKDLVAFLERFQIPHSFHKVVPFIGEIEPDLDLGLDNRVMCIGSYSLRHLAKRKGWKPGVFDLSHIGMIEFGKIFGQENMLNSDGLICSFKDVLYYFDQKASDGLVFIRPTHDNKFFAGAVFDRREIEEFYENIVALNGEPDPSGLTLCTEILLATPKPIAAEYRFWVVDGRVVTGSLYKRGGRVLYSDDVPKDAWWTVTSFVTFQKTRSLCLPRAYVIDIGYLVEEDKYKIIELNTFNASGFYKANIPNLVMAIEEMRF